MQADRLVRRGVMVDERAPCFAGDAHATHEPEEILVSEGLVAGGNSGLSHRSSDCSCRTALALMRTPTRGIEPPGMNVNCFPGG